MCVVSNIGDNWSRKPWTPSPYPTPAKTPLDWTPATQSDIASLRKEMEELRKLLLAAKEYDKAMGQPDCEVEDKVDLIRKFAEMVGVDMKAVFPSDE